MKASNPSSFDPLTWEALREWAGDRVVRRGKSYKSRVEDLCITTDGALLAWVQGGDRYATLVRCTGAGTLSSTCTCPYGTSCKHAVATILAYLDCVQAQSSPPVAESDDERLEELANENDGDEDEEYPPIQTPAPQTSSADPVRDHLARLTKAKLIDLLMEGRDVIPELRQRLVDQAELREGNVPKLIAATRKEIDRATRDPGWQNRWEHTGFTPSYSRLTKRLENLLNAGHADAVVELGTYLLPKGMDQAVSSDDEGETSYELIGSLKVVYQALAQSSLSPVQQILWDVDAQLLDPYDILGHVQGPIDAHKENHAATWSEVANCLDERLASMPASTEDPPPSFPYSRRKLMGWLFVALEKAERLSDIIPVLEREAPLSDCYVDLVQRLLNARRRNEARAWAMKGIEATADKSPGIAHQLEAELRNLAEQEKNAPLVAAFRARDFFQRPSLQTFLDLQNAAIKAKLWDGIRDGILCYLETGRRPDLPAAATRKRKGEISEPATSWPLPSTGLAEHLPEPYRNHFPDTGALIEIAIHEKRPEEVLRWFRLVQQGGGWNGGYQAEQVADAVEATHPNEAISIWKQLVAWATATSNRATYPVAGDHLCKIRSVMTRMGQEKEWKTYLESVRLANKRRPRMMDVLNELENRRTPIVSPNTMPPLPL